MGRATDKGSETSQQGMPVPDEPRFVPLALEPRSVKESVGIAVGLLLASLHEAGLAHVDAHPESDGLPAGDPRPTENERPYLLIPVGCPAPDVPCPISFASHSTRSSSGADPRPG